MATEVMTSNVVSRGIQQHGLPRYNTSRTTGEPKKVSLVDLARETLEEHDPCMGRATKREWTISAVKPKEVPGALCSALRTSIALSKDLSVLNAARSPELESDLFLQLLEETEEEERVFHIKRSEFFESLNVLHKLITAEMLEGKAERSCQLTEILFWHFENIALSTEALKINRLNTSKSIEDLKLYIQKHFAEASTYTEVVRALDAMAIEAASEKTTIDLSHHLITVVTFMKAVGAEEHSNSGKLVMNLYKSVDNLHMWSTLNSTNARLREPGLNLLETLAAVNTELLTEPTDFKNLRTNLTRLFDYWDTCIALSDS